MKPALHAVPNPVREIPAYVPTGNECTLFEHAWRHRLPVLLKGPTGCGKSRFVAHMAARLELPLHTVACHDDLTAADLTGRYLLKGGDTVWADGPLTRAVREGGICYLDEVVEARKDVTVVLHPLTDDRRILPLEKKNEVLKANPDFHLVISYNPGYQSVLKDLKESTKQRFAAIAFSYPEEAVETEIVAIEAGVDRGLAQTLVRIGQRARNLKGHGLEEGASTRMLINAGLLASRGIPIDEACEVALVLPITDDPDMRDALKSAVAACI